MLCGLYEHVTYSFEQRYGDPYIGILHITPAYAISLILQRGRGLSLGPFNVTVYIDSWLNGYKYIMYMNIYWYDWALNLNSHM